MGSQETRVMNSKRRFYFDIKGKKKTALYVDSKALGERTKRGAGTSALTDSQALTAQSLEHPGLNSLLRLC